MTSQSDLVLIGAGRMGSALARGWIKAGTGRAISIVEPKPSEEVSSWDEQGLATLNPEPTPAGIVVLAVKPQMFKSALATIQPFVGPQTMVVSIMGGIRLGQLADRLGTPRVVRAMPNTPGAIGQGVTLFSVPASLPPEDIALVEGLLAPLGHIEGPLDENRLTVATTVSGCGPAYVFLLAEVMANAAEAEGLPADIAERLAIQTIIGSAALMGDTGEAPSDLRKAVTSPGGITQAALDILMDEGGMPALMRKAIRAAANRDRELSRDTD